MNEKILLITEKDGDPGVLKKALKGDLFEIVQSPFDLQVEQRSLLIVSLLYSPIMT